MKIPRNVWQAEVARVGEWWARRNLRSRTRPNWGILFSDFRYKKVEEFKLLCDLANQPGATPVENRKKFADIFRVALRRIRDDRLRVASFAVKQSAVLGETTFKREEYEI